MIKIKINNLPGFAGTLTIQTDKDDVPLERFWRKRLKDAETDNCIEILKGKK